MTLISNQLQPYAADQDSNYPFTDGSTLTSTTSNFIPPNVFLDARLYPPGGGEIQYISTISSDYNGISLTIVAADGVILSGYIAASANQATGGPDVIPLLDTYGREVGMVVIDIAKLRSTMGVEFGMSFDSDAMVFVGTVVVPQPASGVTGLHAGDNTIASGDVWLVGMDGISVRHDTGVITPHLISDPLFLRRSCTETGEDYTFSRPIKGFRINGQEVTPDEFGNICFRVGDNLAPDNIIRINVLQNAIQFSLAGPEL